MRRTLIFALITSVVMTFPYMFAGLEVRTHFPPPEEVSAPTAYEIFARVDLWGFYLMLPVADYSDGQLNVQQLDMEQIKSKLGIGLAFRSEVLPGWILRLSADLPFLEWLDAAAQKRPFKSNFGVQKPLGPVMLEAGVMLDSLLDLDNKNLTFSFEKLDYYFAAGVTF